MTSMENSFLKLSIALTGINTLNYELAIQYEKRLRNSQIPEINSFDRLLGKFNLLSGTSTEIEQKIGSQIMTDPILKELVRLIIVVWYTGELPGSFDLSAEYWFQGLLWEIIHAHTPGLSGNYFGHWTYPPDN